MWDAMQRHSRYSAFEKPGLRVCAKVAREEARKARKARESINLFIIRCVVGGDTGVVYLLGATKSPSGLTSLSAWSSRSAFKYFWLRMAMKRLMRTMAFVVSARTVLP